MKKSEIDKLLKLFGKFGILKEVKRTGWVLKGIKEPESIADHNFRVTIMAMILCDMYPKLNKSKVLELSLTHDWGTIALGDIISEHGKEPVGDKSAKHGDERNVTIALVKELDKDGRRYVNLWDEYDQQKTKESKFLKQIEKLEMTLQAYEYQKAGYPAGVLNEFWENAEEYLKGKELEPIFRQLQKIRKSSK